MKFVPLPKHVYYLRCFLMSYLRRTCLEQTRPFFKSYILEYIYGAMNKKFSPKRYPKFKTNSLFESFVLCDKCPSCDEWKIFLTPIYYYSDEFCFCYVSYTSYSACTEVSWSSLGETFQYRSIAIIIEAIAFCIGKIENCFRKKENC